MATAPTRRIGWRRQLVTVLVGWGLYAVAITVVALAARVRHRPWWWPRASVAVPLPATLVGAFLVWMAFIAFWRRAPWVRTVNASVQDRLGQ